MILLKNKGVTRNKNDMIEMIRYDGDMIRYDVDKKYPVLVSYSKKLITTSRLRKLKIRYLVLLF